MELVQINSQETLSNRVDELIVDVTVPKKKSWKRDRRGAGAAAHREAYCRRLQATGRRRNLQIIAKEGFGAVKQAVDVSMLQVVEEIVELLQAEESAKVVWIVRQH